MDEEELVDEIASIEMERQAKARESGNAVACHWALGKLEALQAREKKALQSHGPSAAHSANLARLTAEITKVRQLTGTNARTSRRHANTGELSAGPGPGTGAGRGGPRHGEGGPRHGDSGRGGQQRQRNRKNRPKPAGG